MIPEVLVAKAMFPVYSVQLASAEASAVLRIVNVVLEEQAAVPRVGFCRNQYQEGGTIPKVGLEASKQKRRCRNMAI